MNLLSFDRQNHLIHLTLRELAAEGVIEIKDKDALLMELRHGLNVCLKECGEIDSKVRGKIASLKRRVQESDSEWSVLYDNYLEEEMARRGLLSLKEKPFR